MNKAETPENKAPVNKRLFGMLGFAMRAGAVCIGSEQVFALIAKGGKQRVMLICYARDASDAAKKKALTKSEFYGVRAIELPITADELGRLLGKTYAPVTVGITDRRFADEIVAALTD